MSTTTVNLTTSSKQNNNKKNSTKNTNNQQRRKQRRNRGRGRNWSLGTRAQPGVIVPISHRSFFRGAHLRKMKSYNGAQRLRVSGVDLFNPPPVTKENMRPGTFIAIPSNPAYWQGTRIAGIASVYQQFRPVKFDINYKATVPTTTPGTVTYGTLWGTGVNSGSLQNALASSPGGGLVSCYSHAWSRVKCNKQNLPQEYFTVAGNPADQSCNPFTWFAYYSGEGDSIPGYVVVHWTYDFVVGTGSDTREFQRIDSINNEAVQRALADRGMNITAIFGIPIGILKSVFMPILRKCAIMLLQGVVASFVQAYTNDGIDETVELPPGTYMEYSYSDTVSGSRYSKAINNSIKYEIPDDAEVIVFQCGQRVTRNVTPLPPTSAPTMVSIGIKEFSSALIECTSHNEGRYDSASYLFTYSPSSTHCTLEMTAYFSNFDPTTFDRYYLDVKNSVTMSAGLTFVFTFSDDTTQEVVLGPEKQTAAMSKAFKPPLPYTM